ACRAVGSYTNKITVDVTLAEVWNGSTWVVQSTPNPKGAQSSIFSGIAWPSTRVSDAVGNYVNASGVRVTLAEQWNGTAWVVQLTPNGPRASVLSGVSCPASTLCAAVGRYINSSAVEVTLAEVYS